MPSTPDHLAPLVSVGALKTGHFQLASGKHSGHYVQVGRLGEQPARLEEALRQRLEEVRLLEVDTVFSAAIGGIVVGQQLAALLGCRHVFAERKDNVMLLRRGFEISAGERVLLVEDVVTTGGTLGELARLASAAGALVPAAFTVIDRSSGRGGRGHPLIACFSVDFPVYDPTSCPHCREGSPLVRPGSKKVVAPGQGG